MFKHKLEFTDQEVTLLLAAIIHILDNGFPGHELTTQGRASLIALKNSMGKSYEQAIRNTRSNSKEAN